jgi:hypothetical protein
MILAMNLAMISAMTTPATMTLGLGSPGLRYP